MKRIRPAGALLLLAGVLACDLPTGMPRWETSWITPSEETTIDVAELLPAALAVNDDTTAFVLTIDPLSESWALSEFCAGCPSFTTVAPKPAFEATVSATAVLAASVVSVDLESGTFDVELTNGFAFDPLRPGTAADSGSITISVLSGGTVLTSVVVDGREEPFTPTTTKSFELAFTAPSTADDLTIQLTIDSPAGDVTTLNPDDALTMSLTSDGILVSEAAIAVGGMSIDGVESELNLEDVDLDGVKDGTIFLDIANPFGVEGELTLTIDPVDGMPIVKTVGLPAASETAEVHFSEAEMQRLIGEASTMTISGTLEPGTVTVTPRMVITIGMRLRVTVEVGGNDDDENN